MADIKDKVVTVESLSALHEHNKETYMTKVNPTGSGSLSLNRAADTTIGDNSVAVGNLTTASGRSSFSEGLESVASGIGSHAEGLASVANGDFSHAEGWGTIGSGQASHVQGRYNIEDAENKYAHIVGNGNLNASGEHRSNAHTLDWHGNAWFAGDVYVGGTSQDDATKLVKTINIASIEYGDTLPEAGTVGRIFFKKISE